MHWRESIENNKLKMKDKMPTRVYKRLQKSWKVSKSSSSNVARAKRVAKPVELDRQVVCRISFEASFQC